MKNVYTSRLPNTRAAVWRGRAAAMLPILAATIALISFVPSAHAAWYDSSYTYCIPMTMTAGGGSGGVATTTTAGFALVATSTIATLAATSSAGHIEVLDATNNTPLDVTMTDGTDCNSDSGTAIPFYFEKYASTTGAFTLWVKASDISSTTAKTVLLYYGNSAGVDQSNEAGVFGAQGEVGVWDLSEDPSGSAPQMLDSTSNNYDGTTGGTMTTSDQVTGQVDGALDFDGSNDIINTSSSILGDTSFTFSIWFKRNSLTAVERGLVDGLLSTNGGFQSFINTTHTIRTRIDDSGSNFVLVDTSSTVNDANWHHYVISADKNGNATAYLDSVQDGTPQDISSFGDISQTQILKIGRLNDTYSYSGVLDDIRVYNRALHAMDILTVYNNTLDSTTFWTFGGEETASAAGRLIRLHGNIRLRGLRLW